MTVALEVRDLKKTFGGGKTLLGNPKPAVHAVRSVNLSVATGETLGVVGESGCGKSTLARMLVGLLEPSSGSVHIEGESIGDLTESGAGLGGVIQYVFQDPISSLNPRKTIRQIIEAPLIPSARDGRGRAQGAHRRTAGRGQPAAGISRTLPARIFRRSGTAHRHCPCPCSEPAHHCPR